MGHLPQQLLGHPELREGESLTSFLLRLGTSNFYQPPTILTDLIFDDTGDEASLKDHVDLPKQAALFERIARLAKVESIQLYAASAHRFTHVIAPPEAEINKLDLPDNHRVSLLPAGVAQKLLRSKSACQYCPLCIQRHAYHRLSWLVIATSVCLEHQCLLVNQCYNCKRPLHVQEIVNARCSKCGIDLRKAPCFYIQNDEFGLLAQRALQGWLLNTPVSFPSQDHLPLHPPRVLFRLVDGLRCTAQRLAQSGWTYLRTLQDHYETVASSFKADSRSLTPYQSYCAYSTAFKGIIHWPRGFYEFLDAQYGQSDNAIRSSSVQKDLGSTYTHWLRRSWQYAEFDFVQDAFNHYIAERYGVSLSILHSNRFRRTPGLLNTFSEVSINYAAELASVTPATIQRLIRSGQLKTTKENSAFVQQADVLKLRDSWNFFKGLEEAAHILGVSGDVVLDMVNIGLLLPEQSPNSGFLSWQFSEKDLRQLLDKIKTHISIYNEFGKANFAPIGLARAARILTNIGLNAASIIACIADGKLQAYRQLSSHFSCKNVVFNQSDLSAYMQVVKAEQGWISREEVTKRLKIKDGTLAKWVRAGLLVPVAVYTNAQYFDKNMVDKFIANHITSEEAAKLLGIGTLAVQRWVRQGRLEAVSGPRIDERHEYLFNKESLLQWRNGRLSSGEAVDILGVSAATLHRWIGEGKIGPLHDMGGKQRWFSREAVLRLNQEMEKKRAILSNAWSGC